MEKINYTDTIREIRNETKLSLGDIKEVLSAIDVVTARHLKNGETIKITPSITLSSVRKAKRELFNVATQDMRTVEEHNVVRLTLSKSFKDLVR